MVVASMKKENVTWLDDYLLDWKKNIYVVDDPSAELSVPTNKGREAMVFLSYVPLCSASCAEQKLDRSEILTIGCSIADTSSTDTTRYQATSSSTTPSGSSGTTTTPTTTP
jgi:hypothetical protein